MAFDINSLSAQMPTALGNATRWDPMAQAAYARILELLRNPGLDPSQLSRSIVDRSRAYQGAMDASIGKFARGGLENSGMNTAVNTGLKAGAIRDADILRRKFAAENEARKRKAMGLYSSLVMFPQMGASQAAAMNQLQLGQENLTNQQDRLDQWGQLAGSLGSVVGGFTTPKTEN
jgi:hypothetical protein